MQEIQDEFIQNIVCEDVEFYYNLHEDKGEDLIQHCLIMADELRQSYQNYYQIK